MCLFDESSYNLLEMCIFLRDILKCFPYGVEARKSGPASNSEIIRMFKNSAIEINGKRPNDFKEKTAEFCPIESLVFFPNAKRRTTIV